MRRCNTTSGLSPTPAFSPPRPARLPPHHRPQQLDDVELPQEVDTRVPVDPVGVQPELVRVQCRFPPTAPGNPACPALLCSVSFVSPSRTRRRSPSPRGRPVDHDDAGAAAVSERARATWPDQPDAPGAVDDERDAARQVRSDGRSGVGPTQRADWRADCMGLGGLVRSRPPR
ncbi:hypothetical protein VTK26DRAFT_451 [Humicola hyalothermophila]